MGSGSSRIGTPTDPPPVPNTSNPKADDIGAHADNFLLRENGVNNISSLDGINFQETIFPVLSTKFFLFERGGNDSGTWQAILEDDTLGPAVQFTGSTDYADTGVGVSGQNAWGVAFLTDQPVKGVRVTASGHDTLSISIPVPEPSSLLLIIVGACGVAWSTRSRSQRAS